MTVEFDSYGKGDSLPEGGLEVPAGLTERDALFDSLQQALQLPEYFGRNWDALEECLMDLSWLPEGQVRLRHLDLPLSGDEQEVYLDILGEAVDHWRAASMTCPRLIVEFPAP